MASEDGISVRNMRLKVLYTFDSENKTNCLARWPHLIDIQTAFIDEETQVGVIELKTCIQAIVSASPELVAKLGRDYTIYAYDYSEYETPLVGQGMLSWVLASASPTPDAPAHQSKTMVTGKVCKNVFGLFSKGAQETLEVKLRLVPVPTIYQNEYLSNMQRYRESSNMMPQEFDAQSWANFVQSNPGLLAGASAPTPSERAGSPMDRSGIERLHQMLSEGSTPRDFSNIPTAESFRADSPVHSTHGAPSRTSTPGLTRSASQQQKRPASDALRPASRASGYDTDSRRQPTTHMGRRNSTLSLYGSGDEALDAPVPKRAKLLRADLQDKPNLNIERQPGSLRVAASTAASVRIHRPMPMNPAALAQASNDDPVRPPTPIPRGLTGAARPIRPTHSNLRRESSSASHVSYTSPYSQLPETAATSPEDVRYGSAIDTPFNMPSSPPVMESMYPQTSSPILPPLPDHDSGFMSGNLESFLDDNCLGNTLDDLENPAGQGRQMNAINHSRHDKTTLPHQNPAPQLTRPNTFPMSDSVVDNSTNEVPPTLPPPPGRLNGSRPSSRASSRQPSKPLAPAPISQSEAEQLHRQAIPASDPVGPSRNFQHRSQSWNGPMSDFPTGTPALMASDDVKVRSGAGARRTKQVQARLEQCIRQGTVPPYCENCGAIETPTWRRAWSKVVQGSAEDANSHNNDPAMLFWRPEETAEDGTVTSFKQFKKTLADSDKDFVQLLLCNPCGLWLHKFKTMRPENMWNKPPSKEKRKRKTRQKKTTAGASTRSRSKALISKRSESSPGLTEASSPAGEDDTTSAVNKNNDTPNDDDVQPSRSISQRANSAEPPKSADKRENRWREGDAIEALRRAIQSSPARNMESRNLPFMEANLTPKPVRRSLFPSSSSKDDDAMRTLSDSSVNVLRRSPRVASKSTKVTPTKQTTPSRLNDGLDDLFEMGDGENDLLQFPGSPTPKQNNRRIMLTPSKNSNAGDGSASKRLEGITSSPSRLTAEELKRASREGSGLTPRAYRISNLLKDDTLAIPSLQDSPRLQSFETIDGLVLDIFDSDDDSIAQTDSFYPFAAPRCPPSGSWVDWAADGDISPPGLGEVMGASAQEGTHNVDPKPSGCNGEATSPDPRTNENHSQTLKGSDLLQADPNDPEIRSFLFGDTNADDMNNTSGIPNSDIFDASLVDPDLLTTARSKTNDGVESLDEVALMSAIMREVNGEGDAVPSSGKEVN
ncbi:hypothetical protein FQN51_002351 [Onygenales sp. PD_10]|nr:hypothetical protein FQN51_002351 [Onygenales sp. PD_10]